VHTTADVLPALRVAVPAAITPQWCSRCYAQQGLLTRTTGPMLAPRRCAQHRYLAAARAQLSSSCKPMDAQNGTRNSGSTPALMVAQERQSDSLQVLMLQEENCIFRTPY
jgi:hypothetical protein